MSSSTVATPAGLVDQLVQRTLRVPRIDVASGDGREATLHLDGVLLGVGFKLSSELFAYLSGLDPQAVRTLGVRLRTILRELVGDHVQHNVYFRRFPRAVPDTKEFWLSCVEDALVDVSARDAVLAQLSAGFLNLLSLPTYGTYQHTYEEMLAAQTPLVEALSDRVTLLHLGRTFDEELRELYVELASSPAVPNEADLSLLSELAAMFVSYPIGLSLLVRERRAAVNAARLEAASPMEVDTLTDILRALACRFDGDVSLRKPTHFGSLPRNVRETLMAELDNIVSANWAKLADVSRFAERWKRLGEGIHPHEFDGFPHAQMVFATARGDRTARSWEAEVERAFVAGDRVTAAGLLTHRPGMMARSLDRLLRGPEAAASSQTVLDLFQRVAGQISGRVLVSLWEHMRNRGEAAPLRTFRTQRGRPWTVPDRRPVIEPLVQRQVLDTVRAALFERAPRFERIVVDPLVWDVAVPMTAKAVEDGFGVLPRGSVMPIDGNRLRFFMYWRQARHRTDYDLSALLLDTDYSSLGHVSYTRLRHGNSAVHSGDIINAPDGASEFIELNLSSIDAAHIVPQIYIFSGEGFDEVAEAFFGYQLRDSMQGGAPFEPRTVRMRSNLSGSGKVGLPLIFSRGEQGRWTACWLHLTMRGMPRFNRMEESSRSTIPQLRAVVERLVLTVGDVLGLLQPKAGRLVTHYDGMDFGTAPVAYFGLSRPDGLPEGSQVFLPSQVPTLLSEVGLAR